MSFNIGAFLDPNYPWGDWSEQDFEERALSLFGWQSEHCPVYREYVRAIGRPLPTSVVDIPFLPISFFKSHKVYCGGGDAEIYFESSGTTGDVPSRHYVRDVSLYEESFLYTFRLFYGDPGQYLFLCLLPSYLERERSSLVYMSKKLIEMSGDPRSGFYLYDWEALAGVLEVARADGKKVILLGVTFALLDFASAHPMDLSHVIVMETGGMKGRREEWIRGQVHEFLKQQWHLASVHSEYGMTELLSQAYAQEGGTFKAPPFMRALVRDESDPFDVSAVGKGCLNIVDLANVYSCAFIATDDIAKINKDGSFEVLGRLDHSALRGCSLMVV